jgi:hypothetical protein
MVRLLHDSLQQPYHPTRGITGTMQVAHLAYPFELPLGMVNCPDAFRAHLAAALPNHSMTVTIRSVCSRWVRSAMASVVSCQACIA